ncbi:MAG: HAMP domain-containing protein [Devosia marina]|uniref:HAMP domain-containing protein n=1 Tax=Devosia marina TaxID=2683198 RepID=UPI0032EFE373
MIALRFTFYKPDDLASVDAVTETLEGFTSAVVALNARLQDRNGLAEAAQSIDARLAELFLANALAATDEQQRLGRQGESQSTTIWLTALVAGLCALICGVALSVCTARWLSRSVSAIATNMDRLAAGDFAVSMAGTDRDNELGRVARALEVFGANGRSLAQAMAREREEAQQTAAMASRRAHLQADLERAVADAVAGQFNQSLASSYGDPDLDRLAGGQCASGYRGAGTRREWPRAFGTCCHATGSQGRRTVRRRLRPITAGHESAGRNAVGHYFPARRCLRIVAPRHRRNLRGRQ